MADEDAKSQNSKQITVAELLSKVDRTQLGNILAELAGQSDSQVASIRNQLAEAIKDVNLTLAQIASAVDRAMPLLEEMVKSIDTMTQRNQDALAHFQTAIQQGPLLNQQNWHNLRVVITREIQQLHLMNAGMLNMLATNVSGIDTSVFQELERLISEHDQNQISESGAVTSTEPIWLHELRRLVAALPTEYLKKFAVTFFISLVVQLMVNNVVPDTWTRREWRLERQRDEEIARKVDLLQEGIDEIRVLNSTIVEMRDTLEACVIAYSTVLDELSSRIILVAPRETPLRLEPDKSADTLKIISPHTQMTLVDHEGNWSRVQVQESRDVDTVEGWILSSEVQLSSGG